MKHLRYLFVILSLLFALVAPPVVVGAEATNAPVTLKGELVHAKELVATNASQIMVEILTGVTTNLYPMLKIAVAPRVYIIEYVVDAVQSYQQSPVRR